MDQHDTKGAVPTDLAAAHGMDLALEDANNVRFLTFWLDYALGPTQLRGRTSLVAVYRLDYA